MSNISSSIVLYKHSPEQIQPLIDAVARVSPAVRLYLIDNSPTDELKVLSTNSNVEYIFNNANVGYGAGHNIAMRKALSWAKYHVVLNPDIMFNTGTLEAMHGYMESNPDVGHMMPKIVYPDGSIQHTCKLVPTPMDLIIRRFLPSSLTQKQTARFEMHDSGYNKIMQVPYMSGCFMFLRLTTLQQAGFFDERFFMYPEDIDLTRRIYKIAKTIFYPLAEATHGYERGSYKSRKLLWIHLTNMIKYFNKWGWIFDKERKEINKKILQQLK